MAYTPRGHVPLADAVKRIADEAAARCKAGYDRSREALGATIKTEAKDPNGSGHRMLLDVERRDPMPEQFTDEQQAIARSMAWYARQAQTVRFRVLNAIQQDLGEGDAVAIAVTPWGARVNVPDWVWRTRIGEEALVGRELSWAETGYIDGISGDPFVREEDVEHWRRRFGDVFPGQPPAELRLPIGLVTSSRGSFVRVRVQVDSSKSMEWMRNAAAMAKSQGGYLGREDGVTQCQAALNCTREIARDAYAALPVELKRPRGKPATTKVKPG